MSTTGYVIIGIGTLVASTLFDLIWKGFFWLIDYPKRSRLDPGFITRIRWYEKLRRKWL